MRRSSSPSWFQPLRWEVIRVLFHIFFLFEHVVSRDRKAFTGWWLTRVDFCKKGYCEGNKKPFILSGWKVSHKYDNIHSHHQREDGRSMAAKASNFYHKNRKMSLYLSILPSKWYVVCNERWALVFLENFFSFSASLRKETQYSSKVYFWGTTYFCRRVFYYW